MRANTWSAATATPAERPYPLRVDDGGQHQTTVIDVPDEHQVVCGDPDLEGSVLRDLCLVGDTGARTRNRLALRGRADGYRLPRTVLFLERDR
jgi:hypothetical protein